MNTITISELKKHGAKSLAKDKTTFLIVNSKPNAAIVPIKDYEMMLQALEDRQDIQAIKDREHEPAVSADEFFADLD